MNFGSSYIKWIRLLYTNIFSSISINGFVSDFFNLERGNRQGCPLSAFLYVVIAEVLKQVLASNPNIEGCVVSGIETVLSQFADDTNALLMSERSIFALFESLALYEKGSGAKVNTSKTKGLWLGSNRGRTDSPLGLTWTSKSITILGLPLVKDLRTN